jgi:hypothetical protein
MRALLSWDRFDADHGWHAETAIGAEGIQVTVLLGPEQPAPAPFMHAIPSWSAETPAGAWIEVQVRARRATDSAISQESAEWAAGRWTSFYRVAQWDDQEECSLRRSFAGQRDADGRVATDTLVLEGPCDAMQPRVLLYARGAERPTLRMLWLALSAPRARSGRPPAFTPRELPVPPRSQMAYPNGRKICSPTSVTMLLAYWHARTGDARLAPFAERAAVSEQVAPQVYDPVYEGYGNWSFNTAFAASRGLEAYVARLSGLAHLEPWIAAGVPVVISVSWEDGQLANAPIPSSTGHLLVVAGFDEQGRVIVADPRGESEGDVRRVYDAAQLEAAWQNSSTGTVYLIHPRGWPAPPLMA